jgi:integrase
MLLALSELYGYLRGGNLIGGITPKLAGMPAQGLPLGVIMQTKLTANLVRVITQQIPPDKEITVFDMALPRFALRARPPTKPGRSWASMYFVRYVGPDGRERKLKIGSPATMELEEARRAARAALAIVDRGGDPGAEKAALRDRWTIAQAAGAYAASHEFAAKSEKGQVCDRGTLRLHIVHHLEHLPLAELDIPRARRLLRAIETDQRTNSRRRRIGGAGAARKSARVLSAMLSWCVHEGRLARNPLIGALRLNGDGQREVVITTPEDYAALFTVMDELVAEGALRPMARAFIIVAALTGCRRGELQRLRWGSVDLAARRLTIISSKGSKLARSGPKTEFVSLPPFAAAALAAIRPDDVGDDELVFVPHRGERFEINRDWLKVRDRAGLPTDLALHSLRHSAGTVAVLSGLSGPEVQKMLRHRNISTTAKYIHLAETARLQDRALGHLAPPMPARETRT